MMTDLTSTYDLHVIEQQVRECLSHYYDYTFLQGHPLLRVLVPDVQGEAGRVQAFRDAMEQAIESLNPGQTGAAWSKQARYYNILLYRYIHQQQVQNVIFQVSVSERQFYRDHNNAIRALSRVVWERLKNTHLTDEAPNEASISISIQSESERIHTQARPEQVQARTFLLRSVAAIQGLIERYRATIDVQVEDQLLLLPDDGVVLRQAIIWILSQLLIQSEPQSRLLLSFKELGEEGVFTFKRQQSPDQSGTEHLSIGNQPTFANLVQVLEGCFEEDSQPGEDYQLRLTVPLRKHSILIIDDNPDAIALFRHFLTGYPYRILAAPEADLALQLAKDYSPELIILDVMLPRQDGWEILQCLKNDVLTRRTPVVVCSVLDSPELARVLGADGFLRKPPSEHDFLEMVNTMSLQRTIA